MAGQGHFYQKGLEAFATGAINWNSADIRRIAVDETYGLAISGATNATPIVITSATHGLSTGHLVLIDGVTGNTAANGVFVVTVLTSTTFSLQDGSGNNIAGNGAYGTGGFVIPLTLHEDLADVAGSARVGSAVALTTKTSTLGRLHCDPIVFNSLTGDTVRGFVDYLHTGTESTSTLIAFTSKVVSGLPYPPSEANLTFTPDSGRLGLYRLGK